MAKYRVYIERTIREWAEVEVEAVDEQEAEDIVWDMACSGDVDFKPDCPFPDLDIQDVDLVEADDDYEIPDRDIAEDMDELCEGK